jgi:8-oxo-dGTP pyrophosphatase MutT (NUDIX family)
VADPVRALRASLLTPDDAAAIDAHGRTDAAVLVPLFGAAARPGLVFTKRRGDLRRHGGEISFPGGRRDRPDEPLLDCALRETEEEIGLDRSRVEVLGALPPVSTVVTGYKVHPFVGLLSELDEFEPNPGEVDAVLIMHVDELRAGFAMRRLIRRGVPIRTPTYEVAEHLVWGATARILGSLLERLDGLEASEAS